MLVREQVPDLVLPYDIAIQLEEVVNQGPSCHALLQEGLIVLVIGLGEKDLFAKPQVKFLVAVNL